MLGQKYDSLRTLGVSKFYIYNKICNEERTGAWSSLNGPYSEVGGQSIVVYYVLNGTHVGKVK